MEERTKVFEENAQRAKLSIDKQLLVQILQEMNRTHDDAVKELEEKLQEENRTHDDAVKELEEKIADLERKIRHSSNVESIPSETLSEPPQEMPEPAQEVSDNVSADVSAGGLQESDRMSIQSEAEAPQETPRKRKRGLF